MTADVAGGEDVATTDVPAATVDTSPEVVPPLTCAADAHVCEGKCVQNNAPATCGTSCQACPAIKNGTATCDGTKCGGSCPAGQKLCLGECIPQASSCAGTCPDASHDCQGVCADSASVNSCGTACTPCPTPAGSRATCDGTKCDFTCQTGKRCTPTANECTTGCCADSECTPPANKVGRCDLATHACVFTCAAGFKPCGNACIPSAGCCDDCAGNRACVSNVCSTTACKDGYKACNGACVTNATCCPAPESCFNGQDDDCDNAADCADPECNPTAMCVPAVTTGFAVGVRVGINDACPAGYTANPKNVHRDLSAPNTCSGCTCNHIPTVCKANGSAYGPTAGDFCAGVSLGAMQSVGANCAAITAPTDISRVSVSGYDPVTTCQAPAGSQGQRGAATWAQSFKFCERVAGPTGGGCASGALCVAKTTATVCALAAGAARACPTSYGSTANWYGGLSDTRTCTSCQCTAGVGACPTDPSTQSGDIFRNANCSGSPDFGYVLGATGGNCSQGATLTKSASVKYLGTPVQASCTSQPSTVNSGAATPTDPQSFCCVL